MATKKKRPKPVEAWALVSKGNPVIYLRNVFTDEESAEIRRAISESVIRVRIVPVVAKAKRRKGAK